MKHQDTAYAFPNIGRNRIKSRNTVHITPHVFTLICLGSSLLSYLAGKWILNHQPELAAQFNEMGRPMIPFVVGNQRQESSVPLKHIVASFFKTERTPEVDFEPIESWERHDVNRRQVVPTVAVLATT
jgi:hypothetical protein